MRPFYFILFLILFLKTEFNGYSQPVDNPYRSRFQPVGYHWSDSLPWGNVIQASLVPGLLEATSSPDSFNVNMTIFDQKMDEISGTGGGVLFFTAGSYFFSNDLLLKSNVIIRGVESMEPNARVAGFEPKTRFSFPKYFTGNPRSSAFKEITADTNGISNSGLVNIDINRAVIGLYGGGWTKVLRGKTYSQYQPEFLSKRIIMFGLRQNNAAVPDPNSPNSNQMALGATASSQAWPWRFGNNIDIAVSENCVVANCRLNDNPTDNFVQPNYILNDNATVPEPIYTMFNYLHHSGIDINRNKIITRGQGYLNSGPHGRFANVGFVNAATPDNEILLFRPGIEIRDNWVKTLTRVKIKASGNGLIIDNNTCMDESGKYYYIRETGDRIQTNNSATYENRGIDFSDWNATVTRNNIFVQQGKIRGPNGYITIDGEAILVQECCGGTAVNNYTISENILAEQSSGYIGLWKMKDLNNVFIKKNNLGGKFIYCTADLGGSGDCVDQVGPPCYRLNGVVIDSNYNISTITVSGKAGGSQCNNFVSKNVLRPGTGQGISATTNVLVTMDNVMNGKTTSIVPVNGSLEDAAGELVFPSKDTVLLSCQSESMIVKTKITCGTPDSVVFYRVTQQGNERMGLGQQSDSIFSITLSLPSTLSGTMVNWQIVARIFSSGGIATQWTNGRTIRKACSVPFVSIRKKETLKDFKAIPNPSKDRFLIAGLSKGDVFSVHNILGKEVISPRKAQESGDETIDLLTFPEGIYLLQVEGKGHIRLIKKQ